MSKRTALISSLWTLAGNGSQQIIAFAVFAYLAHTLTAADFGLVALAAAVIDLLTVFGRFGQVEALMQKGRIEKDSASTSFWLLCGIGLAIMAVVIAVAQPMADAFGEPKIATILMILAPVPLLQNIGQVQEAYLRNSFSYRGLATRNFGATLVSGIASVAAAAGGFGFYALVIQKMVFTIVYTGLVWVAFPWLPRLRFIRSDARNLAAVGSNVVAANLINMLNPRIVDFFVGYFMGVVTLGYLRITWRIYDFIAQLVIQPISSVAMSSLTQFHDDPERLKLSYLRYLQFLSLFAVPVFAGVGLLSQDLILLAAGPRWEQSAFFLSILSAAGLVTSVTFLLPPAMVAIDRTDVIRRQAVLQCLVTAAMMAVAVQINMTVVMALIVARVYIFAVANGWTTCRLIKIRLAELAGRLAPILLSAAVMVAAVAALQHYLVMPAHPILRIAAFGFAGFVIYFGCLLVGDRLRLWRGYVGGIVALSKTQKAETV